MIYNKFQDKELSALAYGCMRFPVLNEKDDQIDEKAAFELIDYALANGINYFDTAWGYHGGKSEIVTGKALARHPRESFYLASKFPGWDDNNMSRAKEIFNKQLEKCGVDYFDFYLVHNVCENNIDLYVDPKYALREYLTQQKKLGKIKHLGFSVHGDLNTTKRFLDYFGDSIEFCQIQLNYLDWELQDAKSKVRLLNEKNIPIWIMEPVRGGKLAKLEPAQEKKLKELRPDESIAAWAFRFLESVQGITTILSGMSDMSQLKDNLKTFSERKPLNEKELSVLGSITNEMLGKKTLPCTACKYCMEKCPQGLDIPMLIDMFNKHNFSGEGFNAAMCIDTLSEEEKPSACIGCKSCETVCPQNIKIAQAMTDFANLLK